MKFHVIDGLLENNLADHLEGFFLGDSVNWNYNPFTTRVGRLYGNLDYPNIIETHQFTHSLVKDDQNVSANPEITGLTKSIITAFQNQTDFQFQSIHRLKANMLMQGDYNIEQHHPPHYDTVSPNHWSMIYYVNRSDGPTRLFDKSTEKDFESAEDTNDFYFKMECIEKIEPRKNRAVIFPSNLLHASACPIQFKRRVVLNFVLKSKG
jgi:hypothetical protein